MNLGEAYLGELFVGFTEFQALHSDKVPDVVRLGGCDLAVHRRVRLAIVRLCSSLAESLL